MDRSLFAIVLSAFSLLTLWVARYEIAAAWRPGSRLQALATQVLVTGGLLGESTFMPSRRFVQIGVTALFAYLLLLIGMSGNPSREPRVRRRYILSTRGAQTPLLMATWAWLYAVNIWFAPLENEAPTRVISGITLLLFLIVQNNRPVTALQFYSASLTTIAAVGLFLPFFSSWFAECSDFKCNGIQAILRGPFASGNLLGVAIAMCAALLMASTTLSLRMVVVLIYVSVYLYGVYSRTSQIAVIVVFCLLLIERFFLPPGGRPKQIGVGATIMSTLVAGIPMAVGLLLIFRSNPYDFSDRGNIWARGREAVSRNVLTGRGIDTWNALENSGLFGRWFRSLFTHSEYLLIYFSGGVIALSLFLASLYCVTHASIHRCQSLVRGSAVSLAFGICGVFEAVWNPLTVDGTLWVFLALTASAVSRGVATTRTVPVQRVGAM